MNESHWKLIVGKAVVVVFEEMITNTIRLTGACRRMINGAGECILHEETTILANYCRSTGTMHKQYEQQRANM